MLEKCDWLSYINRMSDMQWNSVTLEEEEKPRVLPEELREMVADLDPDDFDEPVQEFLDAVMAGEDPDTLRRAATLLLQDEVDLAPDLASMGVEPDCGLIELLLAAGANLRTRNVHGRFAAEVAATPGLAAKLEPPYHPDDDVPLPPEIEDADYDPDAGHCCSCGHVDCDCNHEHGECSCGHSQH